MPHNSKLNELEKLYIFMKKYKDREIYTHKMIYEPYGSYNIPNNKYSKFI